VFNKLRGGRSASNTQHNLITAWDAFLHQMGWYICVSVRQGEWTSNRQQSGIMGREDSSVSLIICTKRTLIHSVTEQRISNGNTSDLWSKCWNLTGTENFSGFPQSLQANTKAVPWISNETFPSTSLPIHYLLLNHLTIYINVKEPSVFSSAVKKLKN
jgi:hypothetical protein